MLKRMLIGLAALTLSTTAGCTVYGPGPAVVAAPGLVVAPVPFVVGGYYPYRYGYYPHRFGYFGYYGFHRGYYR